MQTIRNWFTNKIPSEMGLVAPRHKLFTPFTLLTLITLLTLLTLVILLPLLTLLTLLKQFWSKEAVMLLYDMALQAPK